MSMTMVPEVGTKVQAASMNGVHRKEAKRFMAQGIMRVREVGTKVYSVGKTHIAHR
jgi:hypothetical protein